MMRGNTPLHSCFNCFLSNTSFIIIHGFLELAHDSIQVGKNLVLWESQAEKIDAVESRNSYTLQLNIHS